MPIIKSAKKRVKVANKAAIRNSKTKRNLKTALKALAAKPNSQNHASAQGKIDRALKKGLIHKNKAARLKKKAAAQAKHNNVKLTSKKKPSKTAPKTTKTITKKTPTKKTKS